MLSQETAHLGLQPLKDVPLVVLVGVTGVGKSTTLGALRSAGLEYSVLPNRRDITDAVMIEPATGRPVTDREERFRLTAAYRERNPGGMAHALSTLGIDPNVWPGPLLFDGLRGEDEVGHAARVLPLARFVALTAPDVVRVRRLLGRADTFDHVAGGPEGGADLLSRLRAVPGADAVFTDAELAELAALGRDASSDDVIAKVRIVVSERRNYDPVAAARVLAALPSHRALVLDTQRLSPEGVAAAWKQWWTA